MRELAISQGEHSSPGWAKPTEEPMLSSSAVFAISGVALIVLGVVVA
jgi:hypothetical protein